MQQRFAIDALPVTPWKNGGGSTREVACWPPGASLDAFDWRVSIATIAASGPFSVFPGVDRTIMLLEGDGVRLQSARFDHSLGTPHKPFAFDGEAAVDCSLRGGASTDFNLMVRRARGAATLRVLNDAQTLEASSHGLLLSLGGVWHAGDETLAPGEGLWWTAQETRWALAPVHADAHLAVVQWQPAHDSTPTSAAVST
ncbi:MAG: HutD family protein [Variovorax sp.]|nr:MAG: HutD family protein [Variovorax sp.]